MSTRYALPVKQLKELSNKQSEALWRLRKVMQDQDKSILAPQLERCIRDAYGRLEYQDLIDEYTKCKTNLDLLEGLLRGKLMNHYNRYYNLETMCRPELLAGQIAQHGNSMVLSSFVGNELAEEIIQVAKEQGFKTVLNLNDFEGTALSDQRLNPFDILEKLKQCEDVEAVKALLNTQQAEAVRLLEQRQAASQTGGS